MNNLIKKIGHLSFQLPKEWEGLDGKNRAVMLDDVVSILEEYQRKQPQADKWIPCEVELPPKPRFSEDSYLVKTKCVTTPYTAYWNGEKWTGVLDDDIEDVIAWCPIPTYPQPYKKEGAE